MGVWANIPAAQICVPDAILGTFGESCASTEATTNEEPLVGATVMFAVGVLVHFHQAKIASRMPPHKVRGTSIDRPWFLLSRIGKLASPMFPNTMYGYEARSG